MKVKVFSHKLSDINLTKNPRNSNIYNVVVIIKCCRVIYEPKFMEITELIVQPWIKTQHYSESPELSM